MAQEQLREFRMAVTMKQIAARCGLSLPTVSYVLNGKDELFRPATKERVWAAARELGYRPNSAALAMRSGKFSSVGLVIGIQEKSTYMPFAGVEGIHDALAEVDYHLVVSRLSLKVLEVGAELPKLLRQWMVDGLIYNFTENAKGIPERLEALVDEYKIPAVWLNDKRPQNAVYPDDEGGGKRAAQYLLELGHRKIAYVGPAGEDAHYSQRDRMNGVIETIKAGGGTISHCNLRWNENRREDAKALLSGADKPTAVVTYGNAEAFALYHAALELGLKVPQDLSILPFANVLNESPLSIQFTKIQVPQYEMGAEAARMMLDRIKQPGKSVTSNVLDMKLVEGESCIKAK